MKEVNGIECKMSLKNKRKKEIIRYCGEIEWRELYRERKDFNKNIKGEDEWK